MPPSASKRTARGRKKSEVQALSEPEEVDVMATPSRKRKRGANGTPRQPDTASAEPARSQPDTSSKRKTRSSDVKTVEEETSVVEDDADVVIRSLRTAKYGVQARADFANEVHEVEYPQGKQAYAKIAGNGWTYYVDALEVRIGRPPDEKPIEAQTPGLVPQERTVDIDLGPSKLISRQHADIRYEESNGQWYLNVSGRNGLKVDATSVPRGGTIPLHSGSVIDVAGTQMMFVTPNDAPTIHPGIVAQARNRREGLPEEDEEEDVEPILPPPPPRIQQTPTRLPPGRLGHNQSHGSGSIDITSSAQQYGRLGYSNYPGTAQTIVQNDGTNDPRMPSSQTRLKMSPTYSRGLVLETTDDIDYSVESAKDIKPPHSYAQLIGMAILSSPEEKLTLSKIYDWIKERYAFYKFSGGGWQNSIRHNLSLNKSFEKVARRTDEPGKGMKWQIVPDQREEFMKKGLSSARKPTLHGSPGPNSPMFNMPSSADPDRRLSTTYLRDAYTDPRHGNANSFVKTSPTSTPPRLPNYPVQKQAYTPDRGGAGHIQRNSLDHYSPRHPVHHQNYSPYPYNRGASRLAGLTEAAAAATPGGLPMFGGSDSDSHLYTPMITRHAPKLAPPSTARLPSHFMPLSSPAPFWKYAADFGSTPGRFDNTLFGSPLKSVRPKLEEHQDSRDSTKPVGDSSSSPSGGLPEVGPDSPTRPSTARSRGEVSNPPHVPIERILPPQPQFQAGTAQPLSQLQPAAEFTKPVEVTKDPRAGLMPPPPMPDEEDGDGDDDDDEEGFDLSKGFQPIGSFHRNMTATVIRGN